MNSPTSAVGVEGGSVVGVAAPAWGASPAPTQIPMIIDIEYMLEKVISIE